MSCNTLHLIEDSVISTDVNGIDVTACLAIVQGESLGYPPGKVVTLIIEGEGITAALTNWVFEGAISSNYADLDPTVFAVLASDTPVYGTFTLDDGTVKTGLAVAPKLAAAQSRLVPITPKPWLGLSTARVGKNCWLWEGRLVSPDGNTAIDVATPGYVQVIGRVI